jgi:hypothetical protein
MRTRMLTTRRIYPPAMLVPSLDFLAYMSVDLRQARTLLPHDEGDNPSVLVCDTPHARQRYTEKHSYASSNRAVRCCECCLFSADDADEEDGERGVENRLKHRADNNENSAVL